MSSKLEAVASRLDGAHRSRQLTTKIHSVASGLSGALRKLDGSASLREIELFSKLFDDLDVRSDSVSSLLDVSTSSAMPARQVDSVLTAVAHEFMIPIEESLETTGAICTWQGRPTYDPYEALGVPANAPPERIQQAYRVKARVCHPDKLRLTCPSSSSLGEEENTHAEHATQPQEDPFVIINAAYEMLRKPNERKLFDRNGSGDGGRFARRGASTTRGLTKNTTLQDLFDFIAEGFKLNTDDDDGEDDDEFEDYLFSDANAFDEEEDEYEEERENEEIETDGIRLDWDFAELADLF
ncbi:hypothetical protein Emed_006814 [Eimeria media]